MRMLSWSPLLCWRWMPLAGLDKYRCTPGKRGHRNSASSPTPRLRMLQQSRTPWKPVSIALVLVLAIVLISLALVMIDVMKLTESLL